MKISFYKLVGLFILTALAPWLMPTAIAQVTIAGWDMNAQTNFGTSPLTATTAAANVTIGQLTKGSGIITSGTAATRAWGGGTTSTWGTASATSISNSAFATFTVTPAAGYSLSLSAFNMDYRISGTGPTSLLLQYRINTGAYVDIATYTGLSTNAAGAALPTTSLTGIAALQNLTSASTVTFRIVPYGAVGGTWYIYDRLNTTANDLVLTGTITQILTPTTTSITPSSATAGSGGFTLTVNGTNFTSGSIVQWNGVALTTTFVNATQLTAIVPAANIASSGSASITVLTTGNATASNAQTFTINPSGTPTLTTTPLTSFGDVCVNSTAGPNSFNINASSLTPNVDIKVGAKTGYTYATTVGGTYADSLTLTTNASGNLTQTVYVKFTPTAVAVYNGFIPVNGDGLNANVTLSGNSGVVPAATGPNGSLSVPGQITSNWTNPSCFDEILVIARSGTPPTSDPTGDGSQYTVNNDYATPGTDANLNAGDYAVYKGTGSSVTITNAPTGVTFYVQIFVRRGTAWSAPLTWYGVPSVPPNPGSLTATNLCVNSATVNWNQPSGYNAPNASMLLFVKQGTTLINIGSPSAPTGTYTPSTVFGSGTPYENDPLAYSVTNTDVTTAAITNLTPNTTYQYVVFHRYDPNATYSAGATSSFTTAAAVSPVANAAATNGNAQSVVSWTNPAAACLDEVLVIAQAGSAPTTVPSGDGSAYTANSVFGTPGTNAGLAATEFAVFKGTGTSVNVTGLTNGTAYHFAIYVRRGTYWSAAATATATPVAPPDVTNPAFTNACVNSGTLSWTNPATTSTGTIMVFAKANSPVTIGTPTNSASTYTTASTVFGNGQAYQNDPAAFLVYKGTLQTVNITGLAAGTTYHFLIFNVNPATSSNYSAGATFSGTTPATQSNVTGVSATPGVNTASISWTNPATCFEQVLVIGKAGSAPTSVPTGDGSLYTANSVFGTAAANANLNPNEFAVYKGTLATVSVTSLTVGTTYHFTIFTRRGTTWSSGVTVTVTPVPPSDVTAFTFTPTCTTTGTVSWTLPSGYNPTTNTILVFAKEGSAINVGTPSNNATTYSHNTNVNLGAIYQNDPAARAVYNGDLTSVNITGLTAGSTYHFLAFNVLTQTTYSTGVTTTGTAMFSPVPVPSASTTIGNGQITVNWTNPSCFDEVLVIAKEGSAPTATPTGNGTAYTTSAVFADAAVNSNANLPTAEYAVYKGTGTAVNVTSLTNGETYYFTIYTRIGTTWSSGVTVNAIPNTPGGDYRSIASGLWTAHTTWERNSGGGVWVAATAGQYPNLATANVTVRNGHTVQVTGTGPYNVKNLTVEAGAKLWCNSNAANKYISIHGTFIQCDGIIGHATPTTIDDLGFNIESGAASLGTTISGSGSFSCVRLRKFYNVNTTTDLTINMDVYVTWTGAAVYNGFGGNTFFNVTVNAGKTLRLVNGDLSIDGTNGGALGGANGNNAGTYTINGTVTVAGTTFMTTNNSTTTFTCNIVVGPTGVLNTALINATTSNAITGFTLTLQTSGANGGRLNITGSGAFSVFSTTNNTFNLTTNSTVEYSATASQLVRPLSYANLKINNPAGVTLGTNVTVSNVLDLTLGVVTTGTFELSVINAAAAAVSNFSQTAYVNGKLRRAINNTGTLVYDFPIGTAVNYELAQLTANNLAGVSSILAFFTSPLNGALPNVIVQNNVLINDMLNGGFWTLTPNAQPTGGSYDLKLFERGHTNSAPGGQQSYIILKRANSASAWTSQGTTIGNSQTAGIPPGTVAVPIYGLTTFSDFGIGFGNTVLPVELTLFTATVSNDDVLLNWRTESELNNHYFDVQRSADGFHFESIGSLEGHGTSVTAHNYNFTDAEPFAGVSYYRLRQVDFDGTHAFSPVRAVTIHGALAGPSLSVWPAAGGNALLIKNASAGAAIALVDITGRVLINAVSTGGDVEISMAGYAVGVYFVRAVATDDTAQTKKINWNGN